MKPDLIIAERDGLVVLKRQLTSRVEYIFIVGLTFFVVFSLYDFATSGYMFSPLWTLSLVVAMLIVPLAIWWACTYSWTIRRSGAISKQVGPFSSNDFVSERSDVRVEPFNQKKNIFFAIWIADGEKHKHIATTRDLELAERAASTTAAVLGGNVIFGDSMKTEISTKRAQSLKGAGNWLTLLYLVVGTVTATFNAYKVSPAFGGLIFILGVFLILREVLKLSRRESKVALISDSK